MEDFLVEKYLLRVICDKKQEVSIMKDTFPADRDKILIEEEAKAHMLIEEMERKFSLMKILEGVFLGSKILVYIMGEVICKEDNVETSEGEWYKIYTANYQMIKFVSESGYAIQQLVERLRSDVGLKIGSKEWSFYRRSEA